MEALTDLEITRLCGKAMELPLADTIRELSDKCFYALSGHGNVRYNPLHDDAQAMALFKRFKLWEWIRDGSLTIDEHDTNRSICECVAQMQKAKCPA